VTFIASSCSTYFLFDVSRRLVNTSYEIGGKMYCVLQLSPHDEKLQSSVSMFSAQMSHQQLREISLMFNRFTKELFNFVSTTMVDETMV
jgi:hypothetical protein